jgi:hypothetical protein
MAALAQRGFSGSLGGSGDYATAESRKAQKRWAAPGFPATERLTVSLFAAIRAVNPLGSSSHLNRCSSNGSGY